jgi:uncharacterized RDD family membrane protein YckC
MKCPKCRYIGFETGDRCRNCGYDFSLLSEAALSSGQPVRREPADLQLRDVESKDECPPMDLSLGPPDIATPNVAAPALPLFRADDDAEDAPLVRMAAPRPPIAVRKTPDAQRLRFARPVGPAHSSDDAVFEFDAEPENDRESDPVAEVSRSWGLGASAAPLPPALTVESDTDASPLSTRVAAAVIDFGLLFGIDAVVIHFTLRLTSLTLADWRVIPLTPLLVFLIGLKLTYLSAFTLAGGQTIGKMAMGICVIDEDDGRLDVSQAVRRAVVAIASLAAAGLPFLLALADPARRGLHDRVAHTRVVALS